MAPRGAFGERKPTDSGWRPYGATVIRFDGGAAYGFGLACCVIICGLCPDETTALSFPFPGPFNKAENAVDDTYRPLRFDIRASTASDKGEDLLRESYDNTAGDGEHTVGPLGGVVALEGQAQLEDAE